MNSVDVRARDSSEVQLSGSGAADNNEAQVPTENIKLTSVDGVSNTHKVCYTEDDRVICSVAYTICPCRSGSTELLYGIHFDNFYCNVESYMDVFVDNNCLLILAESNGYSI
jgi:hypothetical protein